jgi:PAS domain S-box-containing protein
MGLDAQEMASRLEFLEFTGHDVARLREVHEAMLAWRETFTSGFYEHLLQVPELRRLLDVPGRVESLKRHQGHYFDSITGGDYGAQYLESRVKVGEAHQRIGLAPKWYIGAYRKYLSQLLPVLIDLADGDRPALRETLDAFIKIIMFDMGIALETYFDADRHEISKADALASAVIEQMPAGLILLTRGLAVIRTNASLRTMFRLLEPAELEGRPIQQSLELPYLIELCQQALASRHEVSMRGIEWMDADTRRFFDLTVTLVDIDGSSSLLVTVQESTALKRAEQASQQFRLAIDMASDAILLIDKETLRLIDVNETVCRMLGYTRDDLLNMPVCRITPHIDDIARRESFEQTARSLPGSSRVETVARRQDGSEFPVEVTRRAMLSNGRWQIVSILRDISERRRTEMDLQRINAELERRVAHRTAELQFRNRDLEGYSYAIAHDLRGPLRALNGYASLLKADKLQQLDEEGRVMLTRISESAMRMSDLITGLLELARLGHEKLQLTEVNLSALAQDIVHELKAADPQRRVAVDVEPGLSVRADPGMMRSLLQNLLANAWKFTSLKTDAALQFGCARHGASTEYFVADNGAGFDMAHAQGLFQAFHRLHRAGEFDGIGIGLATAQRIVERHGGTIRAQAQPGLGATFHFSLGDQADPAAPQSGY